MALSPKLLEELHQRRRALLAAGGEDKLRKRREQNMLVARERLDTLFQPGTFQETGMHVRTTARDFGLDRKDIPADGVITGTGFVGGQLVAAFAQDFTVLGGTLGKVHAQKVVDLMQFAIRTAFRSSLSGFGGARIQGDVDALSG
jgi:acetyl-CoA carboxylase carboxyltransferase component